MAKAARLLEQQRPRPLAVADLPEEILSEILLLLPRCLQGLPPWRLLSFVRDVGADHDLRLVDHCVEALHLRTHEFWSVVRFTSDDFDSMFNDSLLVIRAACDGLVLMSYGDLLYLCNPVTRQWVLVSRLALQHDTLMGLYVHGPSLEYQVLYYRNIGREPMFFINTEGTEKERCISPRLSQASMEKWLGRVPKASDFDEPFMFNGNLHWLPFLGGQNRVLVFDTLNEVFGWLCPPVRIRAVASLLEIEGSLAISNCHIGSSKVDLWVLLDYQRVIWVHKFRIKLSVIEIRHCWRLVLICCVPGGRCLG
ncbi:hypothetical protein ACP4OV_005158 [Aristida adscensionis]